MAAQSEAGLITLFTGSSGVLTGSSGVFTGCPAGKYIGKHIAEHNKIRRKDGKFIIRQTFGNLAGNTG